MDFNNPQNVQPMSMCSSCAEIVQQGYTDQIEDWREHLARCNLISNILPPKHYWQDYVRADPMDDHWDTKCEVCKCVPANFTATMQGSKP